MNFMKGTYAISVTKPKVAALIYDKVWSGLGKLGVPSSISFDAFDEFVDSSKNIGVHTQGIGLGIYNDKTGETINDSGILGLVAAKNLISFEKNKSKRDGMYSFYHDESIRSRAELTFKRMLKSQYNVDAVPVFEAERDYFETDTFSQAKIKPFKNNLGNNKLYATIIDNIPIVDDKQLKWDHVLEFRKDEEAKAMFLRLKHWLNKEMVGQSEQFIIDEINIRLEEYEWAINKHGFKTVLGVLKTVFDHRSLFTSIGIGSAATLAFSEFLIGILAGTSILTAKIAIEVGNSLLDLRDIKLGSNSEVAFIYKVKKEFGKN